MRLVVAVGGNALLQRRERPDAVVQRGHVRSAATALAPLVSANSVVLCHGNGPQIGQLALESADDGDLSAPFPLDTLGAQTQGMIGYWFAQELANAGVTTQVAVLVSQTLVAADDPAFTAPTKFIGRLYPRAEAESYERSRNWRIAADGPGWRRVVPSPEPRGLVELPTVRHLLDAGTTVVCAGGGGVPVVRDTDGLRGVDAVVDKDLAAAQLAIDVHADRLVLLTDVAAVMTGFGTPDAAPIDRLTASDADRLTLAAGSMGPKVTACARFVRHTGRPAVIGSLARAAAVLDGSSGTAIVADHAPATP